MAMTDIYAECFNNHASKVDIKEALTSLQGNSLVEVKVFETGQKGRPKEVWFALGV